MKKSPFRSLSLAPLALVCIALVLASGARGDVPRTISYQGFLTDDVGAPLTGPVEVTFRLFSQLAGGTEAWSEPHAAVQLDEGRFSVALGSVTDLDVDFSQQMYLEIQVGEELLTPRLPMHSAPSAIRAATVDAGAVDTAALADGAVTAVKLGADLAGAGLAQNTDGSLKIAIGEVDGTMLADQAVTNSHVADGADIDPAKIAGTAVTLDGTETLTNKTLTNPVLQVQDSDFTIVDDADSDYSVRLQLSPSGRAGAPTRTLIVPDANGTIALESYVDAEIDGLATVAASGDFTDLINQPAVFAHAAVIPGDGGTAPPPLDAVGTDDTLILEGVGPIALGTNAPRAATPGVTIGLRIGDGLEVDSNKRLRVYVDDDTIGFDGYDALTVLRVTADKLYGLAAVAKSGDYADLNGKPVLAAIATSGEFADIANMPAFARRDEDNTYTGLAEYTGAGLALTLKPGGTQPADTVLLNVFGGSGGVTQVFKIDSEGDVFGNSFDGDGSALTNLTADNMPGLALIATSGSFLDLAAVPDFARRDLENAFTASIRAISIEPAAANPDAPMLQLLGSTGGGRAGLGPAVFAVDTEGDLTATTVTADSFKGDGAGLTDLDAGKVTSGVLELARLPSIPGTKLDPDAVVSGTIEDGTIVNDDISASAAIDFTKLNIKNDDITNDLLEFDSFDVYLGPNFTTGFRTGSSVPLGGTLDLYLDTYNLAGWGLMAAGNALAIDLPLLTPSMATSLPGKGLTHDTADDTIAVDLGDGLKLAAGNLVVPDVDDLTIEVDGDGKLTVKSVDSVPVVLDTAEPTPKHGSLIYKDSVLQVYDDPDGPGPGPGVWIKVGTYQ